MNLPPGAQRNSEAVAALAAVAVSVPPVGSIAAGSVAARPAGRLEQPLHWRWALALLVVLALVPPIATALQQAFYIDLASRILIFALAATSLNLILGFGGMISFGHAAFVGLGAYTVAILMQGGVVSAWVTWPLAVGVSALFALGIGAISLRTRGVYFIMITLAFAQMLYYLMVSLKAYGGEDGLSLAGRSIIVPGLDLRQDTSFYYVALTLFALAFVLIQRILNARFGASHWNGGASPALGGSSHGAKNASACPLWNSASRAAR